jgi:hypothetical protein
MRYTTKYLDSRSHCAQQAQPHYVQLPRSVWEMSGPPLDMPAYYYYNSGGGGGGQLLSAPTTFNGVAKLPTARHRKTT